MGASGAQATEPGTAPGRNRPRAVRRPNERIEHVYAIIQSRGHQFRVAPGETVDVSGRHGEPGAEFTFDEVLLVEKDAGDVVAGAPLVAGARVVGVVDGNAPGPKVRVFKKRRRGGFRKTRGHRSVFTSVRITEIQA